MNFTMKAIMYTKKGIFKQKMNKIRENENLREKNVTLKEILLLKTF